jgi:hypothetical protein
MIAGIEEPNAPEFRSVLESVIASGGLFGHQEGEVTPSVCLWSFSKTHWSLACVL